MIETKNCIYSEMYGFLYVVYVYECSEVQECKKEVRASYYRRKKQRKERGKEMEKEVFLWLGLMVIFLIIELLTVGLTSIWLSGGALVALLISLTGVGFVVQLLIFIGVSFLLLIFTRPFAVKYINRHPEKTNYEELIGKIVKVTETVDNYEQTGVAVVNGIEWTARSVSDKEKIEKGSLAEVTAISGVKLILKQFKEGEA